MVDQKRVENSCPLRLFFVAIHCRNFGQVSSLTSHNGDRCKQNTVRTTAKASTNKHQLY